MYHNEDLHSSTDVHKLGEFAVAEVYKHSVIKLLPPETPHLTSLNLHLAYWAPTGHRERSKTKMNDTKKKKNVNTSCVNVTQRDKND